uniref:N-terminal Ras-GEF domain-containing protein n=1 Tax=Romanomermis culicivorax TaxID=13658 RepID=A0A915L5V8_ROMCU
DTSGLCTDDSSRISSVCSIEYYKRRFDDPEFLPSSSKSIYGTPQDHLQWETVKEKVLKAGTLKKLVKALLDEEFHVDSRHFNVFFATFRAFSEPHDVLRAILAEVYVILSEKEAIAEVRKAVEIQTRSWYNILNWWIDLYPDDFRAHPYYNCLTHLIEFTRIQQGIFHDLFVKCVRRRDDFSRSLMKPFTGRFAIEKFVLSSPADNPNGHMLVNSVKIPSVVHTDATYVAEQLTYLDAVEIFKRLVPHQCQSCFWSKRGNKTNKTENSDSHNVPRSDSQDMEIYT